MDTGEPPKYSDIPVNVLIMGPKDIAPIFERKDEKFFLSENSRTGNIAHLIINKKQIKTNTLSLGTIITPLKMVSNVSVNYKIISGSEENPQFAIDNQGQLTLAKPLDFESQVSHLVGVLAETDSSPPLTAFAEITLQVLDENDHAPHFESSPYILSLAENIEEGTSVLKGIILNKVIPCLIFCICYLTFSNCAR